MKLFLKILLTGIILFMIGKIISTSLKSNLFAEWSYLGSIPWMEATLYDFYANVLCIMLWIFYKEQSHLKKAVWLIFLVTMGSVGTCVYLLKELFRLQDNEDFKTLLLRKNL